MKTNTDHRSRAYAAMAACAAAAAWIAIAGNTAVAPLDAAQQAAAPVAGGKALTISFMGTDYIHRWSQNGQHEFTPAGQEDLARWTDMVTINVFDHVRTGDALAQVANAVLERYKSAGKIVRTNSKPRTADAEAEHFIAAVLAASGVLESAQAHLLLAEGRGMAIVYSHRVYGADGADKLGEWAGKNASNAEKALLTWSGRPPLTALQALDKKTR